MERKKAKGVDASPFLGNHGFILQMEGQEGTV
jgi:hypothetical protein